MLNYERQDRGQWFRDAYPGESEQNMRTKDKVKCNACNKYFTIIWRITWKIYHNILERALGEAIYLCSDCKETVEN